MQSKTNNCFRANSCEYSFYERYQSEDRALIVLSATDAMELNRIVDVNQAWCRLVGYSREELLGLSPFQLNDSPYMHLLADKLKESSEDESVTLRSFQVTRAGESIPVEVCSLVLTLDERKKYVVLNVQTIARPNDKRTDCGAGKEDPVYDSDLVFSLVTSQNETERRMRESEQRYKSLFAHNIDPIAAFDLEGCFEYVNESLEKVSGFTSAELAGKSYLSVIAPERRDEARANFEAAKRGKSLHSETTVFNKQGERVEIYSTLIPIVVDERIIGIHSIAKDITLKKRASYLLDGQYRILEMIAKDKPLTQVLAQIIMWIEQLSAGGLCSILLASDDQTYLIHGSAPSLPDGFNQQVEGLPIGPGIGSCGTAAYLRKQVIVTDIAHDPLWKDFRTIAHQYGLKACWSSPIFGSHDNVIGTFGMYYRETRSPTENDLDLIDRATYLAKLAIQHCKTNEKIHYLAYHDALTGLPNLRFFQDQIGQSVARANDDREQLAILFLDLDRFKQINDSLGHDAGDLLLQKAAKRIGETVKNAGAVYRHGGDEFIILLEHATEHYTTRLARGLLEAFAQPFEIFGLELVVTASIGISLYPAHGADVKTLMKHAVNSMYYVKRQGKNNYQVYSSQIDRLSNENLETEIMLRKALERQEFVLHYQPQADLETKSIRGVEALVRWNNPVAGMIPPDKFIPLAEETGLIVAIGEWVLRTACRQNKAWQEMGLPPMVISVNLSVRQFYQPDLIEMVAAILAETGLNPAYLALEITESMMMNMDLAEHVLQELKALGIKIAIDDFGMGYSSLNYLKRLPTDCLKIDQAFVRDITQSSNDQDIVATIIAMGHTLKKKVTAEGVETKEQLQFLQKQHCDEIQGYYISKPVGAADIPAMVQQLNNRLR